MDLSWTPPVMRAGYAGRGIVYLVVAGFSLWAIWRGGQAQGTQTALGQLESSGWGKLVLVLIALGMLAYAVWRVIDAYYDLEEYGTDGKGMIARAGMIVTGIAHLGIGLAALSVLFASGGGSGEEGSTIAKWTGEVMSWPFGRFLVGFGGLCTIGAGIYYLKKAYKRDYLEKLYGNDVTRRFDPVLRAGVAAQGVIVTILGGFFTLAAWRYDPDQAGGMGQVFDWLASQPFGNLIVIAICLGLLGFAVFLFVNAAYRIIPKVADDKPVTLKSVLD